MAQVVKYPIGEQSFINLRSGGYLYVDKTMYIDEMVKQGGKYYFLGRPRRFGKSLFLSTLQCFFEGRRELFQDLYIDSTDWDWEPHPVLRLDLNVDRYAEAGLLDAVLDDSFGKWEKMYDVCNIEATHALRFKNIIESAYKKTGKQAVILVDEYDKPLVGNINKKDNFDHYRLKLASIYSNFKSSADHIRMVFMTGVTRFSKLSIFFDLNNINDITFDNTYADVCGISETELKENFRQGISGLAENYGVSEKEILAKLKKNYDGYRFAGNGSDMYNPWSVLNAMQKGEIKNYWNGTGLPTIIVEMLKNVGEDLKDFINTQCTEPELQGFDLSNPSPLALMYQTGYLTIKGYDREFEEYRMGIPNEEVRQGLFGMLLPTYAKLPNRSTEFYINEFVKELRRGEADAFMKRLQAFFASIPYDMEMDDERNFHNAVYVFVSMLGLRTKAEEKTSDGRMDITIETDKYIYVVELKYDVPAYEALDQIKEKQYALKYESDSRQKIFIGASFSSKTRRIDDWKIQNN